MTDRDDAEVLFISHQWTAFDHPDPSGEQLESLQRVLRNLLEGKTSVSNNFMLNLVYKSGFVMTGEMWKAQLPKMHLWIDYISIPQPGAVISAEAATMSAELKAELDTNNDGEITKEEMLASPGKAKGPSVSTEIEVQDHRTIESTDEKIRTRPPPPPRRRLAPPRVTRRHPPPHAAASPASPPPHRHASPAATGALIEQLKAAVDSIPSYIERSSQMWILVPPVKHSDLDAAVCDFNSWRRRGWCRMEFAAAKLAGKLAMTCPAPADPIPAR